MDFDARLERYARSDGDGNVSVRRVADDSEILRLPRPDLGALPGTSPSAPTAGSWPPPTSPAMAASPAIASGNCPAADWSWTYRPIGRGPGWPSARRAAGWPPGDRTTS